jgi:uncharacterized protein YqgQ
MFIEVKRLYESQMIDKKTFISAQLVLKREHRKEEEKEKDRSK